MTNEEAGTQNISVSLPKTMVTDLRSRVGRRGVSAYVAAALDHRLRMDRLAEIVADYEERHGPLSEEEIAASRQQMFGEPAEQRSA
ncbi:MAG: CopG family transcriptional regulator [Micrococcales bacterium]|nr:CopG family transcriptional regulator [Micrococcales bacterium]